MCRALAPAFLLLLIATSAHAAATRAFVLTSDYSSGSLSVVDVVSRSVSPDVAGTYSDAVERWYGGLLYVVNRLGADNVQVIDPAQNYTTLRQFSVGAGTNPQDIAFVSPQKAYVSRLGSPDLLIVNPSTGGTLGSIPLAAFADADGNPEPARMTMVGSLLCVTLQRLTNFQAGSDSAEVVLIDTAADTVVDADPRRTGTQAIALHARNPVTRFVVVADPSDPGRTDLLVGCAGQYQVADGGVERIVLPATSAPLPGPALSAGLVTTEATLGGDVNALAAWRGRGYTVVSDASFRTRLVAWDRNTGALLDTVYATTDFGIADIAVNDRNELWVCDNGFTTAGVRIFRAGADTPLAGPLDVDLPPVGITFDAAGDQVVSAPPPAGAAKAVLLSAPWPNPARGAGVAMRLTLAARAAIDADVYDLQGRRVRTLAHGAHDAGTVALAWDLRDDGGHAVAAGLYLVRVAGSAGAAEVKCVVAR